MSKKQIDSGVVYSTDSGRICPECKQSVDRCQCKELAKQAVAKGDGFVRLRRETKGRKGKGVVVISGIELPVAELGKLAKDLKKKCGAGGAVKGSDIEIQGDHRQTLEEELRKRGFRVK